MSESIEKAELAKRASRTLARMTSAERTQAILDAADEVDRMRAAILEANASDMGRAREAGMPGPLQDRLLLTDDRIDGIVSSMREVAAQPDPLGRVIRGWTLDSGIRMEQLSVPLGVVAIVYEARPNVTADAFCLCMRSGNACVLKGGSAAHGSCRAIADACRAGLARSGAPVEALELVDSPDHDETRRLMEAVGIVDVLIPRGGSRLIRSCVESAKVPCIQTGIGNCHVYLHESADLPTAVDIVVNAKTSRPGVCNAAETLLVDAAAADRLLPEVLEALVARGVELVGDEGARLVADAHGIPMGVATEADFATEYDDLKMSVGCVDGVGGAIEHVNRFGTGHSEAIVARDYAASERFLAEVDASSVYVNASTRFTDGGMFGLGAEIGISTQKLHVRGPMGAGDLVSTKYLLRGDGQVR
ncbi:MAG: glutamate-5-semialdehyde dehydrogenase [Atopobiaceae bacterium]|jgi:glutamate-5-semialdehyde dehydrogenase|nr:glutamate-5-semialdehyde dehydrogenase [Atopobiaceae bacterium]